MFLVGSSSAFLRLEDHTCRNPEHVPYQLRSMQVVRRFHTYRNFTIQPRDPEKLPLAPIYSREAFINTLFAHTTDRTGG